MDAAQLNHLNSEDCLQNEEKVEATKETSSELMVSMLSKKWKEITFLTLAVGEKIMDLGN